MPKPAAAALAFVLALCVAASARADKGRIAVLQADVELFRAISLALSPWGVDTIRSDASLPEASPRQTALSAEQLAQGLAVEALVWVTSTEQGSMLWVFDRGGHVTTRALVQAPPFDSAAAAAVALSVKTILRSSAVAPAEERGEAPAPPREDVPAVVGAEFGAGARWLGAGAAELQLRLAGIVWLDRAQRFGLSVAGAWGPGVAVDDAEFSGTYRDVSAAASARVRLFEVRPLLALIALGGALHWASLEGNLGDEPRAVQRLNGSLDLQGSLELRIARGTTLGTSFAAAYSPAYQRYLVAGRPIFSPWPLALSWMGHVGVELF